MRYGAEFELQRSFAQSQAFANASYIHQGNKENEDASHTLQTPKWTASLGTNYFIQASYNTF